jgi:hypothetical protein
MKDNKTLTRQCEKCGLRALAKLLSQGADLRWRSEEVLPEGSEAQIRRDVIDADLESSTVRDSLELHQRTSASETGQ